MVIRFFFEIVSHRTCCEVDQQTMDCKRTENVPEPFNFSNSTISKYINSTNLFQHLTKAPQNERKQTECPKGYKRDDLNPSENCDEVFHFVLKNGQAKLVLNYSDEVYDEDEFCLYFDKKAIIAEVCRKTYVENRFE